MKISGMSYFNRICYTYCYEEDIQHVTFCSVCFHDDAMNNSYMYVAISSKIYIQTLEIICDSHDMSKNRKKFESISEII